MALDWSVPISATAKDVNDVPQGHIIYRARLMGEDGKPRPIPRYRGEDSEGILLLGESRGGRARIRELAGALQGRHVGRGHSAGYAFYHWFGGSESTANNVVFEYFDLAENLGALTSLNVPMEVAQLKVSLASELLVMEKYRMANGDLPPCNTQGPKWRIVTEWMKATWDIDWGYLPGPKSRLNVPIIEVPGVEAISVERAREIGRSAALERR